MFKGLNDSLETIIFCDKNDNNNLDFDILKCLSEQNFENLTKIVVMTNYNISICPKVGFFPNLKVLTVLKLCYIDGFDQNYNTITHLSVEKASMAKLKEYDLKTMVQNFKKLKSFKILKNFMKFKNIKKSKNFKNSWTYRKIFKITIINL